MIIFFKYMQIQEILIKIVLIFIHLEIYLLNVLKELE